MPSGRLIDAALAGDVELAASLWLLAELQGVLRRGKFAEQLLRRGVSADEIFDGYAALVTEVDPVSVPPTVARDPADDHVLACALGARADFIVSGDAHLLQLGSFRGIEILSLAVAAGRVLRSGQ